MNCENRFELNSDPMLSSAEIGRDIPSTAFREPIPSTYTGITGGLGPAVPPPPPPRPDLGLNSYGMNQGMGSYGMNQGMGSYGMGMGSYGMGGYGGGYNSYGGGFGGSYGGYGGGYGLGGMGGMGGPYGGFNRFGPMDLESRLVSKLLR